MKYKVTAGGYAKTFPEQEAKDLTAFMEKHGMEYKIEPAFSFLGEWKIALGIGALISAFI